jgi:hypothetical protein
MIFGWPARDSETLLKGNGSLATIAQRRRSASPRTTNGKNLEGGADGAQIFEETLIVVHAIQTPEGPLFLCRGAGDGAGAEPSRLEVRGQQPGQARGDLAGTGGAGDQGWQV